MLFLPFLFLNKAELMSVKVRGLRTKLAVLDFMGWCLPDSPDIQIRNSCSMAQLPYSLLHVWWMPGS